MIFKHMYIAYTNDRDIEIKECSKVSTATLKYYDNLAVLYFETYEKSVNPDEFATGSTIAFPDGRKWTEATEIFHYFEPKKDSQWERKRKNKKGIIQVNRLEREKIASYIYYHVEHQNDSQVGVDKFLSIFLFDDIIFMYSETPTERISWDDIKGRNHYGRRYNWVPLMNKHFRAWPDGTKGWIEL